MLAHSLVRRDGKLTVSTIGERDELGVPTQGHEHSIDARFHHLLGAHRAVALVFEEVTLEERERFFTLAGLRVNRRQIV